jgi:hypothetical protein
MAEFINGEVFKRVVARKVLANLASKASQIETKSKELLHKSINDLKVVDTGKLDRGSDSKVTMTDTSMIITAYSTAEYAIYPLLGLGQNRKYGPRNYLYRWLTDMSNYLGLKNTGAKYTQVTTQPSKLATGQKSYSVRVANTGLTNKITPMKGFTANKVSFGKTRKSYNVTFKK